MPKVTVRRDEPIEKAIRRFKKLCTKESLFTEARKRRHYIKPSEKRRTKSARARKRK